MTPSMVHHVTNLIPPPGSGVAALPAGEDKVRRPRQGDGGADGEGDGQGARRAGGDGDLLRRVLVRRGVERVSLVPHRHQPDDVRELPRRV
jgi:hypothetical protein